MHRRALFSLENERCTCFEADQDFENALGDEVGFLYATWADGCLDAARVKMVSGKYLNRIWR